MSKGEISLNSEMKYLVYNASDGLPEDRVKDSVNIRSTENGLTLDSSYILTKEIDIPAEWGEIGGIAVNECGSIFLLGSNHIGVIERNEEGNGCPNINMDVFPISSSEMPLDIDMRCNIFYLAYPEAIQAFNMLNSKLNWTKEFNPKKIVSSKSGSLYVLDNKNSIFKLNNGNMRELSNNELNNPVSVYVDQNDFIYILDEDPYQLFKIKNGGIISSLDLDDTVQFEIDASSMVVDSDGFIYVGNKDHEGGIHKFYPNGIYAGILQEFNELCIDLAIDGKNNLYAINNENKVFIFNYADKKYQNHSGHLIIGFNSREIGFKWHKIVLEADIPEKTEINLYYHITDKITDIDHVSDWKELPKFISSSKVLDVLIPEYLGQYLWLKVEFQLSDENFTPILKRIKAYFPRNSYLRYLPAIYQDDPSSQKFLDEFLSIFETLLTNQENKINHISRYFDFETTPYEFLPWLSNWVATIFDESWSEEKKREFLKKSFKIYKKRGTREGIQDILKIYTGYRPKIRESWEKERFHKQIEDKKFKDSGFKDSSIKNKEIPKDGLDNPFSFCVLIKPPAENMKFQLQSIKRIIEQEKPAHTQASIMIDTSEIKLDGKSILGLNTYLHSERETSIISKKFLD